MHYKNLAKWERVVLIILLTHIIFGIANFSLTGVCSYFFSLALYVLLALLSIKRMPKLAIIFITLFLIELGLSIFSPYKSYSEKNGSYEFNAPFFPRPKPEPDFSGQTQYDDKPEFNFAHRFNNIGYNDRDTRQVKYHAFILGDSFVQGIGTDSTHRIDKLMENHINCKDCVLNMGLSGNELVNQYDLLKDLMEQGYSADYVILNLNGTDVDDLLFSAKSIEELSFKGPSYIFQFLYGTSFIFRHFSCDILGYRWNLMTQKQEKKYKPEVKKLILSYLDKYDELCKNNGGKFIVVFQAMHYECQNNQYELQTVIDELDIANSAIRYINLTQIFNPHCDKYFWPIDQHFNTEGYITYSQAMFEEISKIEPGFTP